MTLDLSLRALIDATSGVFFLLIGSLVLALGRRAPSALGLGLLIGGCGYAFTTVNLWPPDGVAPLASLAAGATVAALGAATFTLALGRTLARAPRALLAAFAAGAIAGFVVTSVAALRRPDVAAALTSAPSTSVYITGATVAFAALIAALLLVAAGSALAYRAGRGEAYAFLGVGCGIWPLFITGALTSATLPVAGWTLALAFAVPIAWAFAAPAGRNARRASLALSAAGVAGALFVAALVASGLDPNGDYGAAGIVRTVGAFCLVLAILRGIVLDAPLPTFAVRSGAATAGALAALFIVAEVAQNFLSDKYGLLIGGVVAGALLLAARPIERSLEGRVAGGEEERLQVYRDAARRSLQDGVVTREEEMHLARLARMMGVRHDDAVRIRHEVEDERRRHG